MVDRQLLAGAGIVVLALVAVTQFGALSLFSQKTVNVGCQELVQDTRLEFTECSGSAGNIPATFSGIILATERDTGLYQDVLAEQLAVKDYTSFTGFDCADTTTSTWDTSEPVCFTSESGADRFMDEFSRTGIEKEQVESGVWAVNQYNSQINNFYDQSRSCSMVVEGDAPGDEGSVGGNVVLKVDDRLAEVSVGCDFDSRIDISGPLGMSTDFTSVNDGEILLEATQPEEPAATPEPTDPTTEPIGFIERLRLAVQGFINQVVGVFMQ